MFFHVVYDNIMALKYIIGNEQECINGELTEKKLLAERLLPGNLYCSLGAFVMNE